MPFRVFLAGREDDNAFRASEEITSPMLFCCVSASSLAAISTSSSIARVVLTGFLLPLHHAPEVYIRHEMIDA